MSVRTAVENTLAFLGIRSRAYQLTFSQPAGQEVLKDLLAFCKLAEGPYGKDDRETYRLIGRQDVLRRIQQHSKLTPEQLFALYNGQPVPVITLSAEK
jgi:hypothetical protein